MLPHWDIRLPASWPAIPLSLIILTLRPCPLLIMPSAGLGGDKYQFDKLLVWFDFQHGRRNLYSFGHPIWYQSKAPLVRGVLIFFQKSRPITGHVLLPAQELQGDLPCRRLPSVHVALEGVDKRTGCKLTAGLLRKLTAGLLRLCISCRCWSVSAYQRAGVVVFMRQQCVYKNSFTATAYCATYGLLDRYLVGKWNLHVHFNSISKHPVQVTNSYIAGSK